VATTTTPAAGQAGYPPPELIEQTLAELTRAGRELAQATAAAVGRNRGRLAQLADDLPIGFRVRVGRLGPLVYCLDCAERWQGDEAEFTPITMPSRDAAGGLQCRGCGEPV